LNFGKISIGQLKELITVVKEIADSEIVPAKSFAVVDLWNIQHRSKTRINSRYLD
jgi:hypothetical protein